MVLSVSGIGHNSSTGMIVKSHIIKLPKILLENVKKKKTKNIYFAVPDTRQKGVSRSGKACQRNVCIEKFEWTCLFRTVGATFKAIGSTGCVDKTH
jgi:hypothetical protein